METININYEQIISKGLKCLSIGDHVNARKWFNISMNSPKYRNLSLLKLIKLEIKDGKYSTARQMLKNTDTSNVIINQLCGLLESIEYNFESSKEYYGRCMQEPNMQYKSLLALAKIYCQLGDYDIAKKMFETLRLTNDYYIQASIGLFSCNILEEDYLSAKKIVLDFENRNLTNKLMKRYQKMVIYTKYFLGELNKKGEFNEETFYLINTLLDKDDVLLLSHVEKHHNHSEREFTGHFIKSLNMSDILNEAKLKINDINPKHFELSDQYIIKFKSPIGYIGGNVTSDLCVVTVLTTKDILTMYPVLVSSEYDREGLSKSKELRIKRLQGVRHDYR